MSTILTRTLLPSNRYLGVLIVAGVTPGGLLRVESQLTLELRLSVIDSTTTRPYDDPLDHVVGVDTTGKLTLNQLETGIIADPKV